MLPKIRNSKDNIGTPGLQVNPQQSMQNIGSIATVMPKVKSASNSKKAIEKTLKKTKQTLSSISSFPAFFDFMRKENSVYHAQMENMEKDLSKRRDVRHKEVMDILISATRNKRTAEKKIVSQSKKAGVEAPAKPGTPSKPEVPAAKPAEAPKAGTPAKPAAPTPAAAAKPPAQPTPSTPAKPAAPTPTPPAAPKPAAPTAPAAPKPTAQPTTPAPAQTAVKPAATSKPATPAPTTQAPTTAAPKPAAPTAQQVPTTTTAPPTVQPSPTPTIKPTAGTTKPATEIFKQTAKVVAPTAAKTVAVGAVSLGAAIAKGESAKGSYNAANMGTKNNKIVPVKDKLDLENTTVGEIIRRQSIKWGATNENEKLFAVGKYQIIPQTLLEAVKKLNISPNEKFSGPLQERMFNEYLLKIKRPAISEYLNSAVDDPVLLKKALKQLSLEWASIADPDIPGGKSSHYGSGNKASMTIEEAATLLRADRLKMQSEKTSTALSDVNNVGQKINETSVDNTNMKKDMKVDFRRQEIIQQNIHNTINRQHFVPPAQKQQLNPTMQ
jgi:hypothetical protein